MNDEKPKPELLAPAGTIDAGLAAFDAGADAVYAGLSKFNARERGQNFDFEALRKLIAWAHKQGRRVYVTLNTLLKDAEFPEAVEMLTELALYRPDAIIVQDLGIVRAIRDLFPMLEIHASTQMGIHNSAGARMAQKMGIRRVILERQVTYEEIAEIRKNASIDLEVFVHGALCCCRSGACLFSSWMGGWSGNRGKCKQPCRRRYHSKSGNGFFFSPRDLYSLDALPELRRMGIRSLKIEGRLRRADYVSRVVTAYRMMLDAGEADRPATLKEAKAVLAGALGRKWQPAFRKGKDLKQVIQHTSIGASGLLCGKVIKATDRGFLVELSRTLRINDMIRVQPDTGDEGPLMTLTRMSVNRKQVNQAGKGQQCWIHFDKEVPPRSKVYKTGQESPDLSKRITKLPLARPKLDLDIQLEMQSISVSARWGLPQTEALEAFRTEVQLEEAQMHSLDAAQVAGEFRKSGESRFDAGRVSVSLPDNCFLRASQLKELRRSFWKWVDYRMDDSIIETLRRERMTAFREIFDAPLAKSLPGNKAKASHETTVRLAANAKNPIQGALTARGIFDKGKGAGKGLDEVVLPEFCAEFDLPKLVKKIEGITARGKRRFRIGSLYGFALLDKIPDLMLTASFAIPVCNRLAVRELMELGAKKTTAWVELNEEAMRDLVRSCKGHIEVFTYGRIPLLSTRLELPVEGAITDGRGAGFTVLEESGQTRIYSEKVLSIPAPPNTSTYVDLTHATMAEQKTNAFNYERDFV